MPGPHRLLSNFLRLIIAGLSIFTLLKITGIYNPSNSTSKSTTNKRHSKISKALIVASQKESNVTWLPSAASAGNWDLHTYITDGNPTTLQPYAVPLNKGNEAMVYLTYIIDNYDNFPEVMFFHHHHEQAWHQMFSSEYEFKHLNPASVIAQDYISPRCLPGCENVIELSGDVSLLEDIARNTPRDVQIASVLHAFLGPGEKVPTKIAAPCCAQFAVSREAVLRREKSVWEGLRKWLMETELDSRSSGRVLEYTWHLWFGKEAVFCPAEAQCLCDVYGVGDCGGKEI